MRLVIELSELQPECVKRLEEIIIEHIKNNTLARIYAINQEIEEDNEVQGYPV